MSHGPQQYTRTFDLNATEVGLNAAQLDAERTSSTFSGEGYNQLTVAVDAIRVAYTAVSVEVDFSYDDVTFFTLQSTTIAAGVATLDDTIFRKTTSVSDSWAFNTPINYPLIRLRISSTAGGATDLADVRVTLASL